MSNEAQCSTVSAVSSIVSGVGQAAMEQASEENIERPICSFFLEGKCRFGDECFNFHPEGVTLEEKKSPESQEKKKHKNSKSKKKKILADEEKDEKKAPMKTAGDVRKRIQWDEDLKKEHFSVGYLDRFLGVVEKPFTAFSWQHLADAGLDELAIPQHRIQYFTYRGTKVWDKNERLDKVFGSTGSTTTIQDVMREVDNEIQRKRQTYDTDDSDSDDDFVVCMGNASAVKEEVESKKIEYDQLRASHFLCIRVHNDELKDSAVEVQEHITQQEPILRDCVMPTELFHVTLAMIRIENPTAMAKLVELLHSLQPMIEEVVADAEQRKILAKGLLTFGARVLFAQLQVPKAFMEIVRLLHSSVEKIEGVIITNHFDFVPHMTLMKVNRVIARERRSKYLNSSLYSNFIDRDFGIISIDNINLCVIDDRRGYDGFYLTCKKIEF